VFYVFRGRGRSQADDTTLEWDAGDVLAVPSWALLRHEAHEPSDIFELTDAPVLRALGLYREEHVAGS
jgi:gentisate 1,2-dioxygenase